MRRLALLLLVASCGHRITDVQPWVRVQYPGETAGLDVGTEVVPERAFEVRGGYDATCERSAAPLFAKKDSWEYGTETYSCREKKTKVSVQCDGPCTVEGPRVTPTGEGVINVQIQLDAHDRHYAEHRVYHVIAPKELVPQTFGLAGCVAVPDAPTTTCRTKRSQMQLFGVTADGTTFILHMQITALSTGRAFTDTYIDLVPLVGGTPTDPGYVGPGSYEIELRSGELVRQFTIIYAPDAAPSAP